MPSLGRPFPVDVLADVLERARAYPLLWRSAGSVLRATHPGDRLLIAFDAGRAAAPGSQELEHAWSSALAAARWLDRLGFDADEALRALEPPRRRPRRVGTPLDAARAAEAVVELLWLSRRDAPCAVEASEVVALKQAAGELVAAVTEAEETGDVGDRVSAAITAVRALSRPGDTVSELLATARRLSRGERRKRPRPMTGV